LALKASMELLTQIGTDALARRIFQLTDLACQELAAVGAVIQSDRSPQHKSGIVAFDLPGRDLPAVRRQCLAQGVVLSFRGGRLRISPHAYNDASDVQRLIAALG
jgi:selenocysteine lyase/cysteine desulfurase